MAADHIRDLVERPDLCLAAMTLSPAGIAKIPYQNDQAIRRLELPLVDRQRFALGTSSELIELVVSPQHRLAMLAHQRKMELPDRSVEQLVLCVEAFSPLDRHQHGQTPDAPALVHFTTALVDTFDDDLHVADLRMAGRWRAFHAPLLSSLKWRLTTRLKRSRKPLGGVGGKRLRVPTACDRASDGFRQASD